MCPRCSAPYCSVDCYRGHSQACAREFAEEHVCEELRSVAADLDTQNMMKDILVKMHKLDAGEFDDDDGDDSGRDSDSDSDKCSGSDGGEVIVPGVSNARLEAVARGELDVDDLDEAEVRALKVRIMKELQAVDAWVPWWDSGDVRDVRLSSAGTRLVEVVEVDDDEEGKDENSAFPVIAEAIPPLSSLTSKEPADVVLLFVVDVLFWYCLVLRAFNGDLELGGDELVRAIAEHSAAMGSGEGSGEGSGASEGRRPDESELRAFAEGLLDRCEASGFFDGPAARGVAAGVLNDVATLCSLRRTGVLMGLSDALAAARAAREVAGRRRRATAVERKLVFLLSWANERVDPIASLVGEELVGVYEETMEAVRSREGRDGGEKKDVLLLG